MLQNVGKQLFIFSVSVWPGVEGLPSASGLHELVQF